MKDFNGNELFIYRAPIKEVVMDMPRGIDWTKAEKLSVDPNDIGAPEYLERTDDGRLFVNLVVSQQDAERFASEQAYGNNRT